MIHTSNINNMDFQYSNENSSPSKRTILGSLDIQQFTRPSSPIIPLQSTPKRTCEPTEILETPQKMMMVAIGKRGGAKENKNNSHTKRPHVLSLEKYLAKESNPDFHVATRSFYKTALPKKPIFNNAKITNNIHINDENAKCNNGAQQVVKMAAKQQEDGGKIPSGVNPKPKKAPKSKPNGLEKLQMKKKRSGKGSGNNNNKIKIKKTKSLFKNKKPNMKLTNKTQIWLSPDTTDVETPDIEKIMEELHAEVSGISDQGVSLVSSSTPEDSSPTSIAESKRENKFFKTTKPNAKLKVMTLGKHKIFLESKVVKKGILVSAPPNNDNKVASRKSVKFTESVERKTIKKEVILADKIVTLEETELLPMAVSCDIPELKEGQVPIAAAGEENGASAVANEAMEIDCDISQNKDSETSIVNNNNSGNSNDVVVEIDENHNNNNNGEVVAASKFYSSTTPAEKRTRVLRGMHGPMTAKTKNSKSGKSVKGKLVQCILDAGQKHFGTIQCKVCGMVYSIRNPEDEVVHMKNHDKSQKLRYNGFKNENVLMEFADGKIIVIKPEDKKYAIKKLEEVLSVGNYDLGFHTASVLSKPEYQAYLYVSNKMVVAFIVAEPIKQGFRLMVPNELANETRTVCCEETSTPAYIGINRMWTKSEFRRRGIATRLLNCIRANYYHGIVVKPEQIAFSDPTPDGRRLAAAFVGKDNVLVYK